MRTPVFLQFEASECGAACLGIILAHFGRWESMEALRLVCGADRDGTSAADLVSAATHYGLKMTGWRKRPDELGELSLPVILFWEFNHFVVLEGIGKDEYHLNDPAIGRRRVTEEQFGQSFTGIVLRAEPGPEFQKSGKKPGAANRLSHWLRESKSALAFATFSGLLLALPGIVLPLLVSVFVDYVLTGREADWGWWLVGASLLTAGAVYVLTWMQQRTLRRLATRISVDQAAQFVTHLFRLPIQYIAHRFSGELTTRVQLVDEVASGPMRQLIGLVIDLVMCAVFLAMMFYFDRILAGIILVLALIGVAAMRVIVQFRNDENSQLHREQDILAGIGASGLQNIDSVQATASENDFFVRWTGHQASELVARQRFVQLGYVSASLPVFFTVLGGAVVIGFGGWRVMNGDLTLGTLIAIYMVAANILQQVGRFVQFADGFQNLDSDLQRINDVMGAAEDPMVAQSRQVAPSTVATLHGRLRLSGKIELRDITFGYRRNRDPLIQSFNLSVEPGQRIALIGPTGSGKSTLLKLMNGEYAPWSGEILFDGVPRSAIPRRVLTGSTSMVDQQTILFAASIRENLTMWNPTVPERQLVQAARDSLIHDEIMTRTAGYDARVEEGGRNFSGGQRQRLEIGRALVYDPSILFLDEATSALDSVNEALIDNALRRRGCTCIIVAHRLSTIRDCDHIIVLDKGNVVQAGTHEQLMSEPDGMYLRLTAAH